MSILNSISRGFGSQIGRHGANKLLSRNKEVVIRKSASLTFWQGIKTILWFIPMYILSVFINTIYNMITNEHYLDKSYKPNFSVIMLMAVFFTFIIGYNYYKDNKK